MPQTKVIFYQEASGTVPLISWLDELSPRAQEKCAVNSRLSRNSQRKYYPSQGNRESLN